MMWIIAHFQLKRIALKIFVILFFSGIWELERFHLRAQEAAPHLPAATTSSYSMKDLTILFQDKNYVEFFSHAKDIRPSERNKDWKSMVIQSATDWTTQQKNLLAMDPKNFDTLRDIAEWKELLESESFSAVWREWLLKIFAESVKENFSWDLMQKTLKSVQSEWNKERGDKISFGQDLAKLYQSLFDLKEMQKEEMSSKMSEILFPHKNQNELILALLNPAMKSAISQDLCSQDHIYLLLIELLHPLAKNTLEKQGLGSKVEEFDVQISSFMNRNCWISVREKLLGLFFDGNTDDRRRIYPLLLLDRSLEKDKMDAIFIFYLLDGGDEKPQVAWSYGKLKALSLDEKSRERVMSYVIIRNFLIDEFVSKVSAQRSSFLWMSFHRYFPEYPQYYFKTCSSYLKGEKKFPAGNPTAHCKELILKTEKMSSSAISRKLIEDIKKKFLPL
ncbi:MAG: hypothetical protein QE271_05160 [Bacteriovoracaceae bacterium]|nr:hypothetical protein [Bacteriovoracaceae bacterium]